MEAMATPILRQLEPERAHAAAVALMRLVPRSAPRPDDPALAVSAFGLTFPNPVGLAAGFDKDAVVAEPALCLGFGFTEVGTLTPRAQPGNPRPRVFRLAADRAVINRYGFNNAGHTAALARLERRRHAAGIVGVNIGANKETADRAADYVAGIACFAGVADYFTLNVSSPNTPGLRDLQEATALDDLLARCIDARDAAAIRTGRKPLLLKIAPDLDLPSLDAIVRRARTRGLDGMIVSNTTVARPASLRSPAAREAGGLSGRPLFDAATRLLAETFVRVERQFPLVGVGGVDDADTAWAKIGAGATLIQLYSGLVYEGLGLVASIKRGLAERCAQNRVTLEARVGADVPSWL